MRQWVNRLYIEGYDSNGDGDFDDPLDLEPWYRTERGCIDRIFGHVVYVGNMPGNNPSGRDIAFYIAQALGLYETLENHFGSEEGDLLEDTDPDDESNLMYDSHLGGNSLTTNQSQRLHWALTTRPTLLPLIEIETYFANTIGGSSVYGTLLHYDEVDISSGSYVTLLEGNTYDIGTNEEIIIQGSTQYKHNRWNNNLNDYYLTRNKTINRTEPDYSSQKAKFKAINPVTIEYTPNLPGIVLDLQDP